MKSASEVGTIACLEIALESLLEKLNGRTRTRPVVSFTCQIDTMGCERDDLARGVLFETQLAYGIIFHQLALILSAIFMCLAIGISFWLILDHALHYLRPYEQKQ